MEMFYGKCNKPLKGFFISEKGEVKSCKVLDINCSSCENFTGFCKVCE
jgi:hypothetical protein